jgi:hypothetical protein
LILVIVSIENEMINYINNVMRIPGRFKRRICITQKDNIETQIIKREEMGNIINERKYFISDHIDNKKISVKKLTQLLSTMGEF